MADYLDWDSGISAEEGEVQVPAIGEYDFTVTDLEKTTSKSGKPMAKLTLALDVNGQAYPRHDYLVLSSNMVWKLATFFECVGLKEKGKDLKRMPWEKVVGASGRCKINHEDYNGSVSVKIEKYLPKGQKTLASQAPTEPELPFEL